MTKEHADRLSEELDKLSPEEKLAYYEESKGESLWDGWRDFEEDEFKSELKRIQSFKSNSGSKNQEVDRKFIENVIELHEMGKDVEQIMFSLDLVYEEPEED